MYEKQKKPPAFACWGFESLWGYETLPVVAGVSIGGSF